MVSYLLRFVFAHRPARPAGLKAGHAGLPIGKNTHHALASPEDVIAAGRPLLDSVQMLAVSLGKDGATLISADGAWHALCHLPPAAVKSTVGCGDALLAGFLAGLEQRRPPAECLRLGVACGSACALTPAAGLIYPADVEQLLHKTRLTELE